MTKLNQTYSHQEMPPKDPSLEEAEASEGEEADHSEHTVNTQSAAHDPRGA